MSIGTPLFALKPVKKRWCFKASPLFILLLFFRHFSKVYQSQSLFYRFFIGLGYSIPRVINIADRMGGIIN